MNIPSLTFNFRLLPEGDLLKPSQASLKSNKNGATNSSDGKMAQPVLDEDNFIRYTENGMQTLRALENKENQTPLLPTKTTGSGHKELSDVRVELEII